MLFNACSVKKDKFVNRNWHALNTKYNTLYNGNIAFDLGRETLNDTYQDDYFEVLPIERLEVSGEIKLDSEDNNPNFLIAEEKATKAIQRHSMDIKDEERNPQIDEAFLLLGKARYFDERYIPALESFNYILNKYSESDKLNEASIWREKVNIRLENDDLAIKNLKRLMKYERLKDQEYADARAMLAQAYINLNAPDTAVQNLKVASHYTKKNPEKGRYYYIIGQLYNQMGFKDSANYAFDKVIELNRKSPRVYMINAEIEKLKNTKVTSENKEEVLEYLTKMELNRENRPFLDGIYRQLAEFHLEQEADSLAIVYFNKSLRASQNKPKLNALNYENLAEYNFDESVYKPAGAYYDSVLTNLNENTKKFRAIKKKRDNLEDVIKYEDIVQYSDSVITVFEMPKEEQLAYFGKHIEELQKAKEAAQKKEKQRITDGFAAFNNSKGGKENKGKFYFYNITSLGYGQNDFKNRWGNRELTDDWRWSDKSLVNSENIALQNAPGTNDSLNVVSEDEKFSLDYYMDRLPTDVTIIDSLKTERNFANYQLGLIYKEKFNENLLAAEKLENVLASNAEERLILPSKYNLYKIYEEVGSPLKETMKADIIANHADSRYAEILLNPQAVLANSSDSPEKRYESLFKQYQEQHYLQVITGAEENINRFTGDPIVPKFEMLKANAIGRLQGFELFKEALNYVALTYPNNPEGKKAEQMIAEQLPKLEQKDFSPETDSKGTSNWKVVFPFKRSNNEKALKLMELLEKSIEDLRYKNKVSRDIYNVEDQFVVVHGFKSKDFALGYAELLKNNKDYRVADENFVVLSENYKIIQVHKNIIDYRNTLLTPKP
ncbi:type IX secretion system periplasmic lipoprotein PorW/SprE [Maribacter litoralis]|uniref:Protein involved in gliding motility SprE n=1 Tax=Maribacter litoralis TaxID=2059726 RepID=A0A653R8X0_9FLAO|nr:Protein involved in gliding motility SprE [Maribacter litoralis]